jgi:secreted trypsin-like serine protease
LNRFPCLLLLAISCSASAVAIRHDVDDSKYRVEPSEFPALADMPGEGHGTLIAPQWVLTAAHVVNGNQVTAIDLNGKSRKVERVVVYPGYTGLPQALIDKALAGDASEGMAFLAASNDIALVKLAEPVTDVAPARIHHGELARGRLVKLIGKGGTGNGIDGMPAHGSHRTELRRAYNNISGVDGRWLSYTFDSGEAALDLEGMGANGDSGSPLLVEAGGQWEVAGLASYKSIVGPLVENRVGVYTQQSYNLRVSQYDAWIASVTASEAR